MIVQSVTLSPEFRDIVLFPFSDIHVGSREFDRALFEKYRKFVLAEPNRFCFLNGDLADNAIKNSKSDIYLATSQPREQMLDIVSLLKPLADAGRIWGSVKGNHCERTEREVGISMSEYIADKLGVPYFGPEVVFKVRFGKNRHWRNAYYTIYATHGNGGGRMKSGKANSLDRLKNIVVADIYCMGHTHDQMVLTGAVHEPDKNKDQINEREIYFVNSGSFMKKGDGYAAMKNYEPQARGCPAIILDGYDRKIRPTINLV